MPHPVPALRWIVKRAIPLAMLAAFACARSGELRVLADSTTAPGVVEVLALPAELGPTIAPDPARRGFDSIAALYRRERAALNARAESLGTVDRRTGAYAAASSRYLVDAAAAGEMRAFRDRARRLLTPPRPLPDSVLAHARRAPLTQGGATLGLAAGTWWIGLVDGRGALVLAPVRIEIAAGARDTVRIAE